MSAIEKRQQKEKEQVIEQLRRVPIIEVACTKVGIARATFYRWKHDDNAFSQAVEEAIEEGVAFINALAESKLLGEINNGNFTSVMYWLNHRHPAYGTRVELTTHKQKDELTPEQEEAVMKALQLGGILPPTTKEEPHEQ